MSMAALQDRTNLDILLRTPNTQVGGLLDAQNPSCQNNLKGRALSHGAFKVTPQGLHA